MSSLRDTRIQAIERGGVRAQDQVATLAVTPSVITALEDFAATYGDLDRDLTSSQVAELEAAYDAAFDPLRDVGREVPTERGAPGIGCRQVRPVPVHPGES